MQYIKYVLNIFYRVVTCVFLFSSIYIAIFNGFDAKISIHYVWQIFLTSILCSLVIFIYPDFTDQKLSKKMIMVRYIVHFCIIDVVIMVAGYFFDWYQTDRIMTAVSIQIIIVVVYMMVVGLSYFASYKAADELNQKLKHRSKENQKQ